jgi:hypothetical protein
MKRFLGLAFAVTLAASPLASAQPRHATPHVDAPIALQQPAPTPPTPAPGGALCCCRAWSHGWQYSWRDNSACTAANGTCVSPDHC